MSTTILVITKTHSSKSFVKQISDHEFEIWTQKKPHNNQANIDIQKQLANFLNLPQGSITLIKGKKDKHKVFTC